MDRTAHWDQVYEPGDTTRSWYQEHAATSLSLIQAYAPPPATILDVGGGASVLAADALAAGYDDCTVLDVSATGMAIARGRLGADQVGRVAFLMGDVTKWQPDRTFDVWHDRAVLHFLMDPDDRAAYRSTVLAATSPGAIAVIGVFGEGGPTACSGLPVRRYSLADVTELLGPEFVVVESVVSDHETPAGVSQQFRWTVARRIR